MKNLLSLILLICFLFCGCNAETVSEHSEVTINMPTDNSVNGYRTSSKTSSVTEMPDVLKADEVGIVDNTKTQTTSGSYCGNKNSKVFHSITCASASKTKEENKVYFKTREECISNGYKPCSRCNP